MVQKMPRIDLQWFAEGEPAESMESGDLEVLYVQDGEPIEEPVEEPPKPEGKVLTAEEYEALTKKADASAAIAAPLAGLVERLGSQQPAVPANMQQPGETEEEFYARMEQQAFLPGQFGKVLKESLAREYAPVVNRMAGIILSQAKQIIRNDPERGATFRKYEKEIEEVAQRLPQTPDMYEQAYQQVMFKHQPDIINERMATMEAELEKKILAKYGIDPENVQPKGPSRQPVVSLGQKAAGGQGQERAQSQTIRLYESEKERMINSGLDPSNAYAVQAWLKNHPRRTK